MNKRNGTDKEHNIDNGRKNVSGKANETCKLISCSNFSRMFIALAIALFTMGSAYAIVDLMGLQGTAYNSGVPINNGNVMVTIWDSPAAGTLIYNSSTDFNNEVNNGTFDITLGSGSKILALQYGRTYYMDMEINAQDLDFGGNERKMFESSVGNVTFDRAPQINASITAINLTKSGIGSCPTGQIVQNTTASGVQCVPDETGAGSTGTGNANMTDIANLNASLLALGFANWSQVLTLMQTNSTNIFTQLTTNVSSLWTAVLARGTGNANITDVVNLNNSKGGIGSCPTGQIVQNTTALGVQCVPDEIGTGSTGTGNANMTDISNLNASILAKGYGAGTGNANLTDISNLNASILAKGYGAGTGNANLSDIVASVQSNSSNIIVIIQANSTAFTGRIDAVNASSVSLSLLQANSTNLVDLILTNSTNLISIIQSNDTSQWTEINKKGLGTINASDVTAYGYCNWTQLNAVNSSGVSLSLLQTNSTNLVSLILTNSTNLISSFTAAMQTNSTNIFTQMTINDSALWTAVNARGTGNANVTDVLSRGNANMTDVLARGNANMTDIADINASITASVIRTFVKVLVNDSNNTYDGVAMIPDFAVTLAAGVNYTMDCALVLISAAANTGVQFRINFTGNPLQVNLTYNSPLAATTMESIQSHNRVSNTLADLGSAAANVMYAGRILGYIASNETNTISIDWEMKSEIAASGVAILPGSMCEYTLIQ